MIEQNDLNFYQNNKDCTWQLETVPAGITSDLEIADRLLNKSSIGEKTRLAAETGTTPLVKKDLFLSSK